MPQWVDPKLSVGNILTMIMFAVAAIAGWYSFEARLSLAFAKIEQNQRMVEKLEREADSAGTASGAVDVRLARIEERLVLIMKALENRR